MNDSRSPLSRKCPIIVRAVAIWLLSGALFKLFAGSPNDLPGMVRDMFDLLGADKTFKLAISIELAIAFTTLLTPRLGWSMLALQMLVFIGILAPLVLAGEASCGCFGSKIPIPPAVMMGIDGLLLSVMLLARPWSSLPPDGKPLRTFLVPLMILIGVVAPWLYIRSHVDPRPRPTGEVGETGAGDVGEGTKATAPEERGPWSLPDPLPRYTAMETLDGERPWVGERIVDTELDVWVDTAALDPDSTWILWRQGCQHCAEHLEELARAYDGTTRYVLIQIMDDLGQELAVLEKPPAVQEAQTPENFDFVISTPWEFVVSSGVVVDVVPPKEE